MTTITDTAFDWYQERAIGATDAVIDTVAVGNGTGSESDPSSGLSNTVYQGTTALNIVEISPGANLGELVAEIEVTGGTEIPAGTEVSEMMASVSGDSVIIGVDNFSAVPVESGQTENFSMPITIERDPQ